MSLLCLCYTVTVNNFFLSAFVFVDDLVFLVNETNLNSFISVILNSLDLCYSTRSCLKNCYRSKCSVFVEDLSHSDFCC